MFNDQRSKKVIFLSHCILNQNSISDGTAEQAGSISEIIKLLMDNNIGIIQLPCPELTCLGLDRGNPEGYKSSVLVENSRIRDSLTIPKNQIIIQIISQQTVAQFQEYAKHDFKIIGIIGIDRSPSCGINTTSINNQEVSGKGVFIECLCEEFGKIKIEPKLIGIKTIELEKSIYKIKELIKGIL
jgi:predicted secreted protein